MTCLDVTFYIIYLDYNLYIYIYIYIYIVIVTPMLTGGVCTGSAGKFCSHSVGLYSRSASYHKDLGPLSADQVGHSWLWGVTGEQEWTIEIKTGEGQV